MNGTAIQSLNAPHESAQTAWFLDEPVNEPVEIQPPVAYDRYLLLVPTVSGNYRSFSPLASEFARQDELLFDRFGVSEEFGTIPKTSSGNRYWGFGTQVSSQILSMVFIALVNITPEREVDPLDIRLQLAEIAKLKNGWAEGMQSAHQWGAGYGEAPDAEGLDWLAGRFAAHYAPGLPRPYLYPTPEGGVQAEWPLGSNEASLEIDLAARTGEWHCLDLRTGRSSEHTLDLGDERAWARLSAELRQLRIQG